MSGDEERLARAVVAEAARAEQLKAAGQLTDEEFQAVCRALYKAPTLDEASSLAGSLPNITVQPLPPLEASPVRNELQAYGSYLERFIPESYAGYRLVDEGRFAEIGFVSDLPRHLRAARHAVSFPTRLSAFSPRFAMVELRYALVMMTRAWKPLREEGIRVKTLELSMDRNAVIVGVSTDVAEAQDLLSKRYGAAIVVKHSLGGSA
jgi:hypothetical protein